MAGSRPAPAVAQEVQAAVGGDPVQPGAHRRTLLEAVEAAPRGEQRLLHEILGVLEGADDPVAVQLQLAAVALERLGGHPIARRSSSAS